MEAKTAVSKQLLSRLTHHVRNPFNGIIGFTDLLNNHFETLSDDDKRNYIQIVHQLSKKALLRSENLAWWLKFYTGNLTPVLQNVDITDVIREELNYFSAEIEKQHLDLIAEFNDNAIIQADKVMLQSIIKNILLNIIEFTPVAEEVTISVTRYDNTIRLVFVNVYQETPQDETIAFIEDMANSGVQHATMPDNPGLWTMHTLCSVLKIPLKVKLLQGRAEVIMDLEVE